MKSTENGTDILDKFIIGGGINGCGIARDAAGRGLAVALAEMKDLASATSSSSTKLFHAGLLLNISNSRANATISSGPIPAFARCLMTVRVRPPLQPANMY